MNNIKNEFSIKDLENLSGIKAHTIRIWEKRYDLFHPKRTNTNIRCYSTESLQKVLNVAFLNKNGYKISKIAKLNHEGISKLVKEIASKELNKNDHSINVLKLAMLTFDQQLFSKSYKELIDKKPFKTIFYDVFMPLLNEIGLLWQTETISPAHEHFISTNIKQKILLNIENAQEVQKNNSTKIFVFFLPENEIHDIGLLFINYQLITKGYQTLFLGQSIPIDCLKDLLKFYDAIIFISYFTVKPVKAEIDGYLNDFYNKLLKDKNNELWVLGNMISHLNPSNTPTQIMLFSSIKKLIGAL